MSDLETMREMLGRAGIPFQESDAAGFDPIERGAQKFTVGSVCLTVEDGYPGFFTNMTFHPDGRLGRISAWE